MKEEDRNLGPEGYSVALYYYTTFAEIPADVLLQETLSVVFESNRVIWAI